MNQCKYEYRYIKAGYIPWIQPQYHLHMYKKVVIPAFWFKAKRANKWVIEL